MNGPNHYTVADLDEIEAEVTPEDERRKALDARLLSVDTWFDVNCYDCGHRRSRPIHRNCYEDRPVAATELPRGGMGSEYTDRYPSGWDS